MSFDIRAAGAGDAEDLARMHAACFDEAWEAGFFRRAIERQNTVALLAHRRDGHVAQGFLILQVAAGESEILSLATLPASRRTGTATALLVEGAFRAAQLGAHEMFLEVASDNAPACALYAGLGFLPAGRRSAYYVRRSGPAADALILRAVLPLEIHGNGLRSRLD